MKTLSEVLREADPLGPNNGEPRRTVRERRNVRPTVIDGSGLGDGIRNLPKRRAALATIVSLALFGMVAVAFNWPYQTDVVAAVRFEIHLAEENPAPGLREVAIPGTDRRIYIHEEAVIVNSDIARATVAEGQGTSSFGVDVTFNAEGAAKMLRATQNHIGRPLAVLVDGKVVIAPVVRTSIGASASINGNYSRADAERIVAGVLGR
jgi:hypothetical protein